MATGHGMVAGMFMYAATGRGQGRAGFGFAAPGNVPSMATDGAEAVGDN